MFRLPAQPSTPQRFCCVGGMGSLEIEEQFSISQAMLLTCSENVIKCYIYFGFVELANEETGLEFCCIVECLSNDQVLAGLVFGFYVAVIAVKSCVSCAGCECRVRSCA